MTYRITTEHTARCAARRDVARSIRLIVAPATELSRPPAVAIAPSLYAAYVRECGRFIGAMVSSYPPPASLECPLCRGVWTGDLRTSHRMSCSVVYSSGVARFLDGHTLGDYEPLVIRLRRYARAIGEVQS